MMKPSAPPNTLPKAARRIASVSQAIRAVRQAGLRLDADGEGLWHIDGGGDGIDSAALIALACSLRA